MAGLLDVRKSSTISNSNSNKFVDIFRVISKDQFIQNPNIILSYMMDFGFDSREVRVLKTAISEDRKRLVDAISCPDGSVDGIVSKIANYCYISENALESLVYGIRTALKELQKS